MDDAPNTDRDLLAPGEPAQGCPGDEPFMGDHCSAGEPWGVAWPPVLPSYPAESTVIFAINNQPPSQRTGAPPKYSFLGARWCSCYPNNKTKTKTKTKKRKDMNKGPATLQQCAKRPDLAGWYTGENSGGVRPVMHSAAEENGVSMLREGGHRPRDARAFLSVCGTHSDITKIDHKKNTPHTQRKEERPSFT